jgi:hypothetical protein
MKMLTTCGLFAAGVAIPVSVYLFSNSTYVWRLRKTRELDKDLAVEIRLESQFETELAVNTCIVAWLDPYRDHERVERFGHTTKSSAFFEQVLVPLVEDERLRDIYVRFARSYRNIGNDRKAKVCEQTANQLDEKITISCIQGTRDGIPCDQLLQQLRS